MRKGYVALIAVFAFALLAGSCSAHVTGGGFIPDHYGDGTANFGFNINCDGPDDSKGQVTYHDKSTALKAKGTVTVCLDGAAFGTWTPQGKSSWVGGTFWVTAVDNGEPGTADTFTIDLYQGGLSPEYSNSGTLLGGNIQSHDD